ncbi:MAG: DUF1499 domain-containing protein [Parvibaculum sp.]
MNARKSRVATVGLWLAILSLVVLILSILGNRLELVHFGIAVRGMALAALVGVAAAFLSAVGLVLTLVTSRRGARIAMAGLVVSLLVAAPVVQAMLVGTKVPRIHDITTDLDNPPAFKAVLPLRGETSNPLDRTEPADLAEQQRAAYPDIATLDLRQHPGKVFEAALRAAKASGWEVISADPATGMIEAVATTPVMAFKDDVAIRVTETDTGATVDMRSVSRVGMSDLGANANRIRTYFHALKIHLADM